MANDIGGVWRTVGGRRIFIKDGEDLASAMRRSGKFGKTEVKKDQNDEDEIVEIDEGTAYVRDKEGHIKEILDEDEYNARRKIQKQQVETYKRELADKKVYEEKKDRDTFNQISKFYGYDKLSNDQIEETLKFAEQRNMYHSKNDIEAMRRYLGRTVEEKDTGSPTSKPGKRWEVLEKKTGSNGKEMFKVRDADGNIEWKEAFIFRKK